MDDAYETFRKRGAQVLALSFEPPEHLVQWQPIRSFQFPVAVDPERQVYEAVGAGRVPWWRLLRPAVIRHYWRLYRQWGMPRKPMGDPWQLGGDLWVDRDGRVLWMHLSRDPSDRPTVKRLLDELDAA